MVDIISRARWGARPPRSRTTVALSARRGFMVHHSDGPTTQTPAQIQAFHMGPARNWSDVGYNFLISDDGRIYEGRGWTTAGAHCPGHNTSALGVCVIGTYSRALPSSAALAAVAELYAEANRRTGRQLDVLGHRDGFSTSCPGARLYDWVRDGMPTTSPTEGDDDMVGLRQGDRGERVKYLQELLTKGGHSVGAAGIDGDYGPATSKAVLAAREAEGSKQNFGDRITGAAAKQIMSQFIKAHL
ncbi:N-acetylmuramoyl-L-alanine amidase [Nocardiopsis mangrovi]|uniref:N-acetylmuramoyl-L-alanine amidase n=1 Tax=Nocardiopsis mangrovi TaxID=1179818 RepID=A0ABV9E1Q4_9ACTN